VTLAQQFGVSSSTAWEICRDYLSSFPYKVQLSQPLWEDGRARCRAFARSANGGQHGCRECRMVLRWSIFPFAWLYRVGHKSLYRNLWDLNAFSSSDLWPTLYYKAKCPILVLRKSNAYLCQPTAVRDTHSAVCDRALEYSVACLSMVQSLLMFTPVCWVIGLSLLLWDMASRWTEPGFNEMVPDLTPACRISLSSWYLTETVLSNRCLALALCEERFSWPPTSPYLNPFDYFLWGY
jgi:hypothetical protein